MKLTLNDAVLMTQGLTEIQTKEIPAKVSYWLARFSEKLQDELKSMEKARLKLIEKYAEKDKNGNPLFKKDKDGNQLNVYDFKDNNLEKFSVEFNDLLKEEFEVDLNPINISVLDDIKLKPITLMQLGKIFTGE